MIARVRALKEPFVLVAGYGRAGRRLARSLDAIDRRFVVVDVAQDRIDELALEPFRVDVPALAIDARNPDHLLLAGLGNPACATVVALTGDDGPSLAAVAGAVLREVRGLPGIGNVTSTSSLVRPELIVRPDFARAADLGVTSAAIADTLRVATAGDYEQALERVWAISEQGYNISSRFVILANLGDLEL